MTGVPHVIQLSGINVYGSYRLSLNLKTGRLKVRRSPHYFPERSRGMTRPVLKDSRRDIRLGGRWEKRKGREEEHILSRDVVSDFQKKIESDRNTGYVENIKIVEEP